MTQQAMAAAPQQPAIDPQQQGHPRVMQLAMLLQDVRGQRMRLKQMGALNDQQLTRELEGTFLSLLSDVVHLQLLVAEEVLHTIVPDVASRLEDVESVCDDIETGGMSEELRERIVQYISQGEAVGLKALEAVSKSEGPEKQEMEQAVESWRLLGVQLLEELTADDEDDDDEAAAPAAAAGGENGAAQTTATA